MSRLADTVGKAERDVHSSSARRELGWDSLETRRNQSKLTMAFKILNDFLILDKSSLPKKSHFRPSRKCSDVLPGPEYQLEEQFARLNTVQNTFYFDVPKLWNNLVTQEQASSTSIDAFKSYFKTK